MRKPNGYGSVYKLSGKRRNPFCVKKVIGWNRNEETGKTNPIYEYIGYYPTRKEAELALANYNANPYAVKTTNLTLKELLDMWYEDAVQKVGKSTSAGYRASVNNLSGLHDVKIEELKLLGFQKFFDSSTKSIVVKNKMKVVLSLAYDYAIRHEILPSSKKDLISYIEVKGEEARSNERKPFNKSEIAELWKERSLRNDMLLVLIYSGLRVSELLSLKKEDVHLDERWFYVRQAKTSNGIREVPIHEKLVSVWSRLMQNETEYAIANKGKQVKYRTFNNWMEESNHTVHDTRHTTASLLAEAMIDERIVRSILGHSGKGITEQVYTHIGIEAKIEAINKISCH